MIDRFELLKQVAPFTLLPDDVLEGITDLLQEVKFTRDAVIYHQEESKMKGVDIIAEGEYEAFFFDSAQNKRSADIYQAPYCYGGVSVLLNRTKSLRTVLAKKGTLVYHLPRKDFKALCQAYEEFFHYFTAEFGKLMLDAEFAHFVKRPASFEGSYIAYEQYYSRKVGDIEPRPLVYCTTDTPIFEAARTMSEQKTGCLFVKRGHDIAGYVTDLTLRDNVVARKTDVNGPVGSIMDNPIISIDIQAHIYEAILLMFRTKTRYLLVTDKEQFAGFISRTKLISEQGQSPFVFIQSVKQALTVNQLKSKWEKVPEIVTQLLGRGVNARIVNQLITTIADTIAIKVIEGVINEMGSPPAKFVFMVLGSEGRKEQTLKTDQDNAIIYEDKANEHRELVREYFLKFAGMVSDRLNDIGFSYCTGGFMAKNSQWTHSLSHWKRNYEDWLQKSVPETAIKFSTFFDCRYLYGDETIINELKIFLDEELQKPLESVFFHMANNALQYEPPLTFFKKIRTITIGSQEVFDMKRAMTPIVDLVRVYALKNRIFEVNTGERLKALKEKGIFSETEYHELTQSYYFLMSMRLKKQAIQITDDKTDPDNYIHISSLTKIEQVTLKEIFKTIQNFQSGIKLVFTNNLFG